MTRERLEQWHYITVRIEQITEQLRELEGRALPKSPDWSGKARSASPSKVLDALVPDIIERRAKLTERRKTLRSELSEIEAYVDSLTDEHIRSIIIFRCCQCLTWNEIADRLGGKNSEDSVKKMYYRFFMQKI